MKSRNLLLFLVLSVAACQEIHGDCPEITDITPNSAGAVEEVEISGHHFALGHQDLWGDGAQAVPPQVWLDISLRNSIPPELESMFTPEDLAAMAAMDMSLEADQVVFESGELLRVTTPDLSWSDIETGATMMGASIPTLPANLPFPLASTVRVINPSECESAWDGDFFLIITTPPEGQ